jgi:AraC-like DNA-binding protein
VIRVANPSAELAPFVRSYVHLESRALAGALRQPIAARTAPALEFTFGNPYRVWVDALSSPEIAHRVAVIGMQTYRRVELEIRCHAETFVIVFQPGGLSHLFALRADALTDAHFEASAVLGRSVDELWARLAESVSFAERVGVAEAHLLRRRGTGRSPSVAAAAARELLRGSPLRIPDLAAAAGLGVRQFERRFGAEIGVAPKLFARVARFEIALQRKQQTPGLRWTDLAQDLGYHDQSHMGREFLELAGSAPSVLASQADAFAVLATSE